MADDYTDYITQGAIRRGLNPKDILRLVDTEGGRSGITGDSGTSFGPFQMHVAGALPGTTARGLGDEMASKGLNPRDPYQSIDYALDYIQQHGTSPDIWHGLRRGGAGDETAPEGYYGGATHVTVQPQPEDHLVSALLDGVLNRVRQPPAEQGGNAAPSLLDQIVQRASQPQQPQPTAPQPKPQEFIEPPPAAENILAQQEPLKPVQTQGTPQAAPVAPAAVQPPTAAPSAPGSRFPGNELVPRLFDRLIQRVTGRQQQPPQPSAPADQPKPFTPDLDIDASVRIPGGIDPQKRLDQLLASVRSTFGDPVGEQMAEDQGDASLSMRRQGGPGPIAMALGMAGESGGRMEPPALREMPATTPEQAVTAARSAEGRASESPPVPAEGGGSPPATPPRQPPANAPGPDLDPPPGIKATSRKLDDDLYTTLKNNEADMVEARQFVESLPPEWLTPQFSEKHYTEAESRLVRRDAPLSSEIEKAERAMKPLDDDIHRIATELRTKHPELAEELPDLLTAEQGYVHRKVIGRPGPGERLDPGIGGDVIGASGRSLGKRAASLERRTGNFVGEDEAGNRIWSQKLLGQSGAPAKYGEKYRIGDRAYTARRPTTQEIERNTPRRYVKNRIANTIDNWLRLRRIKRNIDLLDQWKPKLFDAGAWVPRGSQAPLPPHFVPVDLPQLQGYAEPLIAHTLNDFYRTSPDDFAGFLAKANRFLIGTMFALPVRHQINVLTHYTIGRGFDWVRDNPQLIRATRAVTEQNGDYIRLLRAGAGLQYANTLNQNFYKVMLEKLFHDQMHDPGWAELFKQLNVPGGVAAAVKAQYEWSRKALWKVNDVFLVGRIMELEGKGLPTVEAIRRAEQEIPNYRIPAEVAGSRMVATALKSPAAIAFGRYTYGKYRAIAETVKNMIGPVAGGDPGRRMEALGQAVVMAMLGTVGYKIANGALQSAMSQMGYQGKPMEFVRGGPLGMMQMILDPGERDFMSMLSTFISPAPGTQLAAQVLGGGKNPYTGQPIYSPSASPLGKGVEVGEFLAQPIYPLATGIDVARRGPLAALGPGVGVKQSYTPPSGRVQRMIRNEGRRRERRDPIEQAIERALP